MKYCSVKGCKKWNPAHDNRVMNMENKFSILIFSEIIPEYYCNINIDL